MISFFSDEAQAPLRYPNQNPQLYSNFMSFYTNFDDLKHKSFQYSSPLSFEDGSQEMPFASQIAWKYPKRVKELEISISVSEESKNTEVDGFATGFTISQPYGIELYNLRLLPGENGIRISPDWFDDEDGNRSRTLPLKYTKGKNYRSGRKYGFFTLSSEMVTMDKQKTANFEGTTSAIPGYNPTIGWGAVGAKVLDSHSIRVYLTDMPYLENLDFRSMVLDVHFSESLRDCNVGSTDLPGYFANLHEDMSHEEAVQKSLKTSW